MASSPDPGLYQRYLRYGIGVLIAFAVASIVRGTPLTAIASGLVGVLMAAVYWAQRRQQGRLENAVARATVILVMGLVVLGAASHVRGVMPWGYLVPLAIFVAWPLRWALGLSTLFTLVMVWLASHPHLGAMRHQYVPSFLLCTGLSCVFVYLREIKARQLAPLRRTDTLTLASTQEHLNSDLYKEIQRSEREGTDLAVVALALTLPQENVPPSADQRALLREVGRILHEQLRDFDSYYRIADAQFLLILPGNRTAQAVSLAERLRRDVRDLFKQHDTDMRVSAGVASLNVGDDGQSLQQKAFSALKRALSQGGNRIQSFTDAPARSGQPPETNTGAGEP